MALTDRIETEHRVLVDGCGLIDRSELGKLALTGSEARTFLQGQVTNDVEALQPGDGCYAAFLTHKGKMLGDLRVIDDGDELLLLTERVALQALFDLVRRTKIGYDVELHKRTLERGLLSLVGPEARRVAGARDLPEQEHANRPLRIGDVDALAIATDVGVDLTCDSERTSDLRAALEDSGATTVSDAAAEVLRVERGRPRYGIDLDASVIPDEAGLNERAVSFTKGCYVGQETVARLFYKGRPNRHLRGLHLSTPCDTGDPVFNGDRQVATLGSTAVSPALGPIALALMRREVEVGDEVAVGEPRAPARVVELPFRIADAVA